MIENKISVVINNKGDVTDVEPGCIAVGLLDPPIRGGANRLPAEMELAHSQDNSGFKIAM